MITQEYLHSIVDYQPETGLFFYKNTNKIRGTKTSDGYWALKIDKKLYRAHRLAWLYVYGNFPEKILDHINRNKLDNRIDNLRQASFQQSVFNTTHKKDNTSGFRGVYWESARNVWKASIVINDKHIYLGRYKEKQDAIDAYQKSAIKYHKEFYCG